MSSTARAPSACRSSPLVLTSPSAALVSSTYSARTSGGTAATCLPARPLRVGDAEVGQAECRTPRHLILLGLPPARSPCSAISPSSSAPERLRPDLRRAGRGRRDLPYDA